MAFRRLLILLGLVLVDPDEIPLAEGPAGAMLGKSVTAFRDQGTAHDTRRTNS